MARRACERQIRRWEQLRDGVDGRLLVPSLDRSGMGVPRDGPQHEDSRTESQKRSASGRHSDQMNM